MVHGDDHFDTTVEQRFSKRFDVSTAMDGQSKDKTKQELANEINTKMSTMNITNLLKRNKNELRTLATDLDIVLTKQVTIKLISKRWVGKAKELLEVLWERG